METVAWRSLGDYVTINRTALIVHLSLIRYGTVAVCDAQSISVDSCNGNKAIIDLGQEVLVYCRRQRDDFSHPRNLASRREAPDYAD